MKVFYQSKLARWLLWQGYSTITLGCFVFSRLSRKQNIVQELRIRNGSEKQ